MKNKERSLVWSLLFTLFFLCPGWTSLLSAQKLWDHGPLQVTADGHYLQHSDGTPFFWLGDTAWELFHRLTPEEIRAYLDNRTGKTETSWKAAQSGTLTVTPPSMGGSNDWVLVAYKSGSRFRAPGTPGTPGKNARK